MKLTKEDIKKYATEEEKKLLKEGAFRNIITKVLGIDKMIRSYEKFERIAERTKDFEFITAEDISELHNIPMKRAQRMLNLAVSQGHFKRDEEGKYTPAKSIYS